MALAEGSVRDVPSPVTSPDGSYGTPSPRWEVTVSPTTWPVPCLFGF
jgi:hypothetical protein